MNKEERTIEVKIKIENAELSATGNVKDVDRQVKEFYQLCKMLYNLACLEKTEEQNNGI